MSSNQYRLNNALFSQLLSSSTRNIRYKIPHYQRGYVWGEEQWEDLYNDIRNSKADIFMGVIICIEENVGQPPVVVRDVVDGQQRMTTLFILLLALWKKMGELAVQQLLDSGEIMNTTAILDIKRMLYTSDDGPSQLRLEPAKVNSNQSDLYKLICELDDYSYAVKNQLAFSRERTLEKLKAPTVSGSALNPERRAIWKCFNYFYNRLSQDGEDLAQIYNRCEKLQFVLITCDEKIQGYYLFQVLNDRGVDLSEMDVIKSYIFGDLGDLDSSEVEKYHNEWVILENSLNTKTVRERFFRHLFNSSLRFKYEKSGEKRPETNRRELVRNYSELITEIQPTLMVKKETRIQNLYEDIIYAGTEYTFLSNPENVGGFADTTVVSKLDEKTINRLEALRNIEAATANMLLLKIHLWIHEERLELKHEKYVELLDFLCAFYIRRNIMGLPSTNKMDPFVVTLVDKLTEKYKGGFLQRSKIEWDDLIKTIKSHYMDQQILQSVSWADFKKTLQEVDMYKQHKKILNVLFGRIEEHYSQLIPSPFHSDSTNIDHIYPQNPSNGEKWSNYVGLLGNLTPVYVKVNSAFSNAAFDKKRDYKDKDGNPVGYAHGRFKLDRFPFDIGGKQTSLATIDKWTKESITNRTNAIIKYLHENNIISLPGDK